MCKNLGPKIWSCEILDNFHVCPETTQPKSNRLISFGSGWIKVYWRFLHYHRLSLYQRAVRGQIVIFHKISFEVDGLSSYSRTARLNNIDDLNPTLRWFHIPQSGGFCLYLWWVASSFMLESLHPSFFNHDFKLASHALYKHRYVPIKILFTGKCTFLYILSFIMKLMWCSDVNRTLLARNNPDAGIEVDASRGCERFDGTGWSVSLLEGEGERLETWVGC